MSVTRRSIEAIRRANQPPPPENSVLLRVACTATVLVAIGACASLGEVAWPTALGAMALVVLGMAFSYRTRTRPPGWIKAVIAVAAIAAFVWFFHSVIGHGSGLASVDGPLTVLLITVLVVHSFHVPGRRDLLFSIGASAGLMAIGGAQAVQLAFGLYALVWAGFALWSLTEMWASVSGGGRVSGIGLAAVLGALVLAAAAVFVVLPAPTVSARINFLSASGLGGAIGAPGALAGDSGTSTQLAQAGTRRGPTRVGGYLGFAGSLDTALRGTLSHQVVMRVRAQRPSFWVGETFDRWDGQNWGATTKSRPLRQRSPFVLPVPSGDNVLGQTDLQTFYVANPTANLIFHAESAAQLWFPTSTVYYSPDGTIVSPIGLGQGSIYTVDSDVSTATPAELRRASDGPVAPPAFADYVQLPHPYARAHALALAVTAGDTTTYDQVHSLIAWIAAHTSYSTTIPPLPAGADTVNQFLFGSRVGFCEQISTSLTVMLRSLGIPAREAVGYVPGPYNPVTDLYEVRADDAHAWTQVWFPGLGWQSFDPTAVVATTNPAPGTVALTDLGHALRRIPPVPVGAVAAGAVLIAALVRWRRSRPGTWAERAAHLVERAGRRARRPRLPSETLAEYAAVLDTLAGTGSSTWRQLASAAEASAYGNQVPPPATKRQMLSSARRTRVGRHQSTSSG